MPTTDAPPESLSCCAGDMEVKILVEPLDSDGMPTGIDTWISAVNAKEATCRWFPLQGIGAVTVPCTQGMTFAPNMRVGIDASTARDARSWLLVALSRSVVPADANLAEYFLLHYPPGAVCVDDTKTRTQAAIDLRAACTHPKEAPD
ncbi:MAG TPA: hypothetical protein EYQ81_12875 [Sneathiellales bacterium]|nr:hypothetical protein [Sneathiellales bacterium]